MLHLPHILLLTGLLQAPPGPPGPPMPPADEDRPSEDLRVEIVPTIWFPRMLGSYTIGPEGTSLDVETDTYLHDSELAFQGELDYRFDEWTIRILGSEFSTSGNGILSESARVDGVALAPGDDWESEYAQWSIGIEVDYAFWRKDSPNKTENYSDELISSDHQYIKEYTIELGYPWENTSQWLKVSSPFFNANKIKTPTLFLVGEKDYNVPLIGSEQMYQALMHLSIPTQLIIYPDEYHSFSTPSYEKDVLDRYLDWYKLYLLN